MPRAASASGVAEDVRAPAVASDAERQDRRMLDEQQHVVDPTGAALLDEGALQRERLGVRHQAEPPNVEGAPDHHALYYRRNRAGAALVNRTDGRRTCVPTLRRRLDPSSRGCA